MAENSNISWCHHTGNLWWGCTKVHAGCDFCYAETLSERFGNEIWGNDVPRLYIKSIFNDLNRYQRKAKEAGEIHRVFVGSMMDIFEKPMPLIDSKGNKMGIDTGHQRALLFYNISNNLYPNLMFLLLTKRPSNINKYIPESWKTLPPDNVMFGTSPVNQETANKLIPQLMKVKGKRFLSIEPMLSSIDITNGGTKGAYDFATKKDEDGTPIEWFEPGPTYVGVDWVIVGGESGANRRPFDLEWARDLKKQCDNCNVPFFFKQIDKVRDISEGIPQDLNVRQFPSNIDGKSSNI